MEAVVEEEEVLNHALSVEKKDICQENALILAQVMEEEEVIDLLWNAIIVKRKDMDLEIVHSLIKEKMVEAEVETVIHKEVIVISVVKEVTWLETVQMNHKREDLTKDKKERMESLSEKVRMDQ